MDELELYKEARKAELCEIVKQYPRNIPIKVVAKYLGIDVESLRSSILRQRCPYGLSYQVKTQNGFFISTLPFILRECNSCFDAGKMKVQ